MVLRKERNLPLNEGNNSSSTSSSSSSSRIMSNEQPVSKRQRIDNRNIINNGETNVGTPSSSTTTTTTTAAASSSSSLQSASSSTSSSSKVNQEIRPDILVHPSTSASSSSSSSTSLVTVGVTNNNNNGNNLNSSNSSINSNNTNDDNCSHDEVDRVNNENHQQEIIPDLLRLSNCNNSSSKGINNNSNNNNSNSTNDIKEFEEYLMKQCLCNVNERILRRLLQNYYEIYDQDQDQQQQQQQPLHLYELPTNKLIQFLSNLQLLFDIYLKQNTKGFICNRIMEICNILIQNDIEMINQYYNSTSSSSYHHHHHSNYYHHNRRHHSHHHQNYHFYNNFQYNLIDEIIELSNYHNKYVQFLSIKVLSSFLVISKNHTMIDNWLKKLVDNLFIFDEQHLNYNTVKKINFSLEIIKRIVEWKDIDIHPLDDDNDDNNDEENGNNSENAHENLQNIHDNNDENDDDNGIMRNDNLTSSSSSSSGNGSSSNNNRRKYRNAGISLLPQQQPSLENNYFARNYNNEIQQQQASSSSSSSLLGNDSNLLLSDNSNNSNNSNGNRLKKRRQQQMMMTEQNENDMNGRKSSVDSGGGGGNNNDSINNSENDNNDNGSNNSNSNNRINCQLITLTDSESFDTTQLKCLTIKILENKWPALVKNMSTLIQYNYNSNSESDGNNRNRNHHHYYHHHHHHRHHQNHNLNNIKNISENCILTFLLLWENIISVKANLSIIETLPFYSQLDKFENLLLINTSLSSNLSCLIYKQMLNLFNEALCYGSTLALQDLLPEETCQLAHQIVRHVKDYRILDSLPKRKIENSISFIGYYGKIKNYDKNNHKNDLILNKYHENNDRNNILDTDTENDDDLDDDNNIDDDDSDNHSNSSISSDMDKTILQKMVLLILKSIAVTVKEIRSDSSDSSIDSQDYDAFQDMILIERSIRDVLKKLELFIKQQLEFHPECHFSKILIHLFDDQDDYLIESMVCTLDVISGISFRNNAFPELIAQLNPIYTFLEFLKMISNSTDLLLDLLVSNETCFLLYLLRFLKYIRINWSMFVASCHEFNGSGSGSSYRLPFLTTTTTTASTTITTNTAQSSSTTINHHHNHNFNHHHQQQQISGLSSSSGLVVGGGISNTTLDDAMSVLIRLRLQISRLVSKSLYPYDISPVLRLLESCESLYEGNELS